MITRLFAVVLTTLALTSSASATVMSIGYESPLLGAGITPVLNVANPVNGFISSSFTVGNFNITTTFHAGSTIDLTGTVSVTAIDQTVKDWVSIYLSISDITAPTGPVTIKNAMTVDMPTGWWLDRTAYIDDAAQQDGGNGIFSLTTYLQPPLIYDHGGTEVFNSPYTIPPGLYSLTQFYSIQSTPVAVPFPVIGAGLPGIIIAALAVAGWHRRRRVA